MPVVVLQPRPVALPTLFVGVAGFDCNLHRLMTTASVLSHVVIDQSFSAINRGQSKYRQEALFCC